MKRVALVVALLLTDCTSTVDDAGNDPVDAGIDAYACPESCTTLGDPASFEACVYPQKITWPTYGHCCCKVEP